jgi:hypothetical protein
MLILIEISNEIRDERLRFIDAMKHATTINIQSMFPKLSCMLFFMISVADQVAVLRKELAREIFSKVEHGTTFGNYHPGHGEQNVRLSVF